MKYVRIKDNIYHITDKECLKTKKENHPLVQIIKESDKLEDLCDEFVLVGADTHRFQSLNFLKNCYSPNLWDIYGAIWTDKGLIYVAKLNKNGELELV